MLGCHAMMRALLAAAAITLPTAAHAGTYLGLGVGTEPAMSDSATPDYAQGSGRSLRILGGMRFGNFSLEANFDGFGVVNPRVTTDNNEYALSGVGKLSLPFGSGFEGYGRVGLERTWLSFGGPSQNDFAGNGYLVGAGVELRLDALLAQASIFIDYTLHSTSMTNDAKGKLDQSYRMWTLGFSVGI